MEKEIMPEEPLHADLIKEKIYIIRGKKVMFDKDLAMLYGVSTGRLNEAVKRNVKRFPEDFMFLLNKAELEPFLRSQSAILKNTDKGGLISQIAISNRGGIRKPSFVFTEQGIAMLSSVLNSDRAIAMNIQIIRIFTKLREMIDTYKELREKVEEMERENVTNFREIFRIIRLLIKEDEGPKGQMGFRAD